MKIPAETTADELFGMLYHGVIPKNAPPEALHAALCRMASILADHEAMLLRLFELVGPLGQSPLADPTDEEIAEAWQGFQKRHGALGGVASGTDSGEGAAVDIEDPKVGRFGGQWGSTIGSLMGKFVAKDEPGGEA